MDLRGFRALVDRMVAAVPPKYLDGVFAIEVSPKTVRHPVYPSVFTLGECIPVEAAEDPPPSRVVLYHGSFQELARERRDFDWRAGAWETLTHELRHHLEWRARSGGLDAYDWAAGQHFRRARGRRRVLRGRRSLLRPRSEALRAGGRGDRVARPHLPHRAAVPSAAA